MTDTIEEDYVQPPQYINIDNENHTLITKLSLRIQKDLSQINGIYNHQIADCEKNRLKTIQTLDQNHSLNIDKINKQRYQEISSYNEQAEKHINSLICKSYEYPEKWSEYFYRLFRS